jgi:PEP-CTERM motif
MMKPLVSVVLLSAGVLALMYGPADALTVTFFDPPAGAAEGTVTAEVTDLPAGVTFSTSPPGPIGVPEGINVTITGALIPPGQLVTGVTTNLTLTETPDVNPATAIGSDVIGVSSVPPPPGTALPPQIFISFSSDAEAPFVGCGGNFLCKFEGDPNPFLTFTLVNAQGVAFPGPTGQLVINAFSDVHVPEPTTLLLLGAGLAGLGALRYRRSRAR